MSLRKTYYSVLCLAALVMFSSFQQVPLKKQKLNDKITISLPETFRTMTDEEVVSSYTMYRKPLALFLDIQDPKVHLGVNVSASRWRNSDLPMLKEFYKATILDLYSEVDFVQDKIIESDGKSFAVFEFTSAVKPTDKEQSIIETSPIRRYYYIQYTVVDGEVIIFNFNAPIRVQLYWADIASKIMSSIRIKS